MHLVKRHTDLNKLSWFINEVNINYITVKLATTKTVSGTGKLGEYYGKTEVAKILQVDWLIADEVERSGLQTSSRYCKY